MLATSSMQSVNKVAIVATHTPLTRGRSGTFINGGVESRLALRTSATAMNPITSTATMVVVHNINNQS
jgi:hypothetical protein